MSFRIKGAGFLVAALFLAGYFRPATTVVVRYHVPEMVCDQGAGTEPIASTDQPDVPVDGPKGLDPAIVDVLHRAFRKALEDEASQAIIRRWDMPQEYLGPADYLAFAKARVEYEKQMVARLGLTID